MLWVGQVFSQLADKIFLTLQVALLSDRKYAPIQIDFLGWHWSMQSDARLLTLFIASTIPAVLLGSAAGIFVDRRNKKSILVHCNLWRGVMLLLLPILPGGFALLLLVVFLESILTQFFAPAEQSAIPFLVKNDSLVSANSLFATTMIGSIVVGNALGAPLFSLVEHFETPIGKELIVGVLYILGSAILSLLPMREQRQPKQEQLHPWSDFKAGLAYLGKSPLVSNAMVQLMLIYSVFAALTVLSIHLTAYLNLEEKQFGFLIAAAGIGMIVGAAILNIWHQRLHHKPLPLLGFLSVGFVLFLLALIKNLWLALMLSSLLGLGSVFIVVPMQTLIQQQTPEAMRGKVFGFQNNVINVAITLPLVLAEVFTKKYGLPSVLVGLSSVVVITGVWTWRNSRKVLQDAI